MIEQLSQPLITIFGMELSGLELLGFLGAVVFMGWTYLKGLPALKKRREAKGLQHKTLNEIREPVFKDLVKKWGKNLNRTFRHDSDIKGIVDKKMSFYVADKLRKKKSNKKKKNKKSSKNIKKLSTRVKDKTILPDHLETNITSYEGYNKINLFFIRQNNFKLNLMKKFVGIPKKHYDLLITPEDYILDADDIVLDKNVNIVKYAGIDTVWCRQTQGFFEAFQSKDLQELMDEGLVNFMRDATHFDKEISQHTMLSAHENNLEREKWEAKEQSDAEDV